MSTNNLEVGIDLEAQKQANEEKLRLANEKLLLLKKQLEDAQKIVRESPEQNEQLKKKLKDAHDSTTDINNALLLLDEEDDKDKIRIKKDELVHASQQMNSVNQQLKEINQKFEQAKLDEIRLKKEVDEQQIQVENLKKIPIQNSNSQTEGFQSRPTKSFPGSQSTGNTTNIKNVGEQKQTQAFEHFKSLCSLPNSKYHFNNANKEVEVAGKGGIITFTKNGASTESDKPEDIQAMARDLFNAYIKTEDDLKTVSFNPSGPQKDIMKTAIEELKAKKLNEFQNARNNPNQNPNGTPQSSAPLTQSVVGRVENDQRERSTRSFRS